MDVADAPRMTSSPSLPKAAVRWYEDFKLQALIVGLLAFLFYCNTFKNEYALDDNIVIVKNEYVYQGFSGLKDIFAKDAFDSYVKRVNSTNELSGGRYRPLSIATFAIEQQFLDRLSANQTDSVLNNIRNPKVQEMLIRDMRVRHVGNVLWYTLAVVALLWFLRAVVFKSSPAIAFLAAIIFTVHPIHTEVVANVKSRDEIMSLLFICLTFVFAFKYREQSKKSMLVVAMLSLFLAFLSKEYAIAMLALLPLSFFLFDGETISKSLKATLPYLVVTILYILIRFQAIPPSGESGNNDDVWNNPYALAQGSEGIATRISTLLNYLRLLILPHPLSSDYSYNTIPYKSFANPLVWLSIVVHAGLVAAFVYFVRKRHVLSFAIAFYLFFLLLVSNLFINIGGTMGERLIFHSSVGFAIAVAYLLYHASQRIKPVSVGDAALGCLTLAIVALSGFQTIERNKDWKNDFTLYSKDIRTVPNSLLVNANLGVAYIDMADLLQNKQAKDSMMLRGIPLLNKAIMLQSTCIPAYINKGIAYFRMENPDSAKAAYDQVARLYPNYPALPELIYNTGVMFFKNHRAPEAAACWQTTLKLNPNYKDAQNGLNVLYGMGYRPTP